MTLIYASTFLEALTRLSQAEAGAAIQTAIRIGADPRGNGLQMHRIDDAPDFWSVRVNRDVRIILHKNGEHILLAYVGHHDDAYRWAERKRLVPHERTGAMQFVEVPVVAGEPDVVQPAAAEPRGPASVRALPFAALTDDQLLDVGVPRDWLEPVRVTAEDNMFELLERLPAEAAEALLDFATGGRIEDHVAPVAEPAGDPFAHPDALRRFRTIDNLEELKAALEQPFAKWAVFLHPAQRALVEREWTGPARVSGSAGTGKTIVALHRAVHLARADVTVRVLLTTFSKQLANALAKKLELLTEASPTLRERIDVRALDQAAHELFAARFGRPNLATSSQIRAAIADARKAGLGGALTPEFLFEEWTELVDAWNVTDADSYVTIPRLGRRTRLGAQQREAAWAVFAFIRRRLEDRKLSTWAGLYAGLAQHVSAGGKLPYDYIVVDEAQDLSVAQVRFLAAVARERPGALFLAGDIGQRIFHLPFSWARLGLDIRGRSHSLKVNYRTSHQIRLAADRLLPASITDLDGIAEGRRGTVSVFDGPEPDIRIAGNVADECAVVAAFIEDRLGEGAAEDEIGILVRGEGQLGRARAALKQAGLDPGRERRVTVSTMHGAKGLEFRAVAVIACDDDVLPDPARLAGIGDMAELEAAFETERHLLYVACTRARDHLLVTAIAPGSEFLGDLDSDMLCPSPNSGQAASDDAQPEKF